MVHQPVNDQGLLSKIHVLQFDQCLLYFKRDVENSDVIMLVVFSADSAVKVVLDVAEKLDWRFFVLFAPLHGLWFQPKSIVHTMEVLAQELRLLRLEWLELISFDLSICEIFWDAPSECASYFGLGMLPVVSEERHLSKLLLR